jgi:protein-arginine kinase activator protein McsA
MPKLSEARLAARIAGEKHYISTKPCYKCGSFKKFVTSAGCHKCYYTPSKEYFIDWNRRNPEKIELYKKRGRLARYKLTVEQYDALHFLQGGKCSICQNPIINLHVDHDHKTGKVRGLLCNNCNTGLGSLRDSLEILKSAVKYLESSKLENRIIDDIVNYQLPKKTYQYKKPPPANLGTKWIMNGIESKKIMQNDALPSGWSFGRPSSHRENMKKPKSPEFKIKLSIAKKKYYQNLRDAKK